MDFTTQSTTTSTGAANDAPESSIETFAEDVMAASQTKPILVDFFAPWSEASIELSANLKREIDRTRGAIGLVRVNVDNNKTLLMQLQVQSAPTVIIFFRGQPVDGFQGALPSDQLAMVIDRLMQATGADQTSGADAHDQADPIEEALAQMAELKVAGQQDQADLLLERILDVAPEHPKARLLGLELALKSGQMDQVKAGLDSLDAETYSAPDEISLIKRLKTAVSLTGEGDPSADTAAMEKTLETNPQDHQTRFNLALSYQSRGDLPKAAEALLGIIMRERDWQEQKARLQLVKLFDASGPGDAFTLKYRRRLSSVLFS